jgi:hypothetical protein
VLAKAKDGTLLQPQLIYACKTERCLPKCDFPDLWDITFRSLKVTGVMKSPCFVMVRQSLYYMCKGLTPSCEILSAGCSSLWFVSGPSDSKCCDKVKGHWYYPLFVPACCTDRLQSVDVAVNYDYKDVLMAHFHEWYTQQVTDILNRSDESTRTPGDLKSSTLKPIHAKWIVSAHTQIENWDDQVQTGFRKAGLLILYQQ